MGNVKSLATRANGEQPWHCTVCGAVMAYSQPINFRLCMELGKLFTDWHEEHCTPPPAGPAEDAEYFRKEFKKPSRKETSRG